MAKRSPVRDMVAREYLELVKYHGAAWSDLGPGQVEKFLAARMFYIICQNSRAEAGSGDPLGEFIAEIHSAMVDLLHKN